MDKWHTDDVIEKIHPESTQERKYSNGLPCPRIATLPTGSGKPWEIFSCSPHLKDNGPFQLRGHALRCPWGQPGTKCLAWGLMPADTWPQHWGPVGIITSVGPGFCLPKTGQLVYIDE